ncbi:hypothetical protein V1389_01980 [Flavobacterium rakeshii]|uniref:hypothetical protein n=1 Tax=Flavobacterium rakeshii TaxID=1038845 RepID=UPI002E7AFA6E|nr:hypothetical protein [Flavobacterium rakeshii]MEE1897085.1 hypothetical protein [Flavobacterium rakeshii]
MDAKTKKTALIITGTVAAGIILYMVLKKKTDTSGATSDPTQGASNDAFNPAITAELLYQAMKDSGTYEDAIFNALKNVNATQFAQVMQKFGKQSYNKLLGNQIRINPLSSLPLEPLQVWLKNELSQKDYKTLQLKYPQLT